MSDVDSIPSDEHGDVDAGRAFEEMRAEVTIMRRAMEALSPHLQKLKPPDYGPSFGGILKSMQDVEKRLAVIEAHPGLRLPPDQYGALVAHSGTMVLHEVVRPLRADAEAIHQARRDLASLVADVADGQAQRRGRWLYALVGVIIGLVAFPVLTRVVPGVIQSLDQVELDPPENAERVAK